MDYEHLITYAEQVWGIVGPDGYKHEDLILLIVNGV